jgi:hypothetical protein
VIRSVLFVVSVVSVLLSATATWAQSLTPINGWVPLNSVKAKALEQTSPVKGKVSSGEVFLHRSAER